MIEIFRGYVQTKDKKPIQKFKGVEDLPTIDDVKDLDEYAGILNNDYTVMDVDDGDEADRVFKLVKDLGLNCRVVKTTRGMHFIFKKNNYASKGSVHQTNALGITFDIRTGINQYIVVKKDGKVRETIREFDETKPIAEYPKYFGPISSDNKFTGLKDGDGRNGKLFAHIATLVHNGFCKSEVIDIIGWINDYIFDEPLEQKEIKMICRDESFTGLTTFDVEDDFSRPAYKPKTFSDIDMAELFAKHYKEKIRFNPGTGWLVWNEKVWEMSGLKAEQMYIAFIKQVKQCAIAEMNKALQSADKKQIAEAQKFYNYVLRMSDASKISAVLKLARSFLEIEICELDANPFELNTPEGIVDLKTGSIRSHDPESFCTKITSVGMSNNKSVLFDELLDLVTSGDKEYQNYLQELAGAIIIGKVYNEGLIIAFGSGANGKSTLFNTIAKVLGPYAGKMPAESLTTQVKNAKVDLAELFGKRFILAGETEEGQRLSNKMLKQVASSDPINAEKKYHDPFTYEPTHTPLLYTNFLPRLTSLDNGTKRRIIICPFNATINVQIKDYAEKLLKEAGGVILKWMVDGAKKFIDNKYQLSKCKVCDEAREEYFESNDWLTPFIDDCCIVDKTERGAGGLLYKAYREWCNQTGEYVRRNNDFAESLKRAGFESKRTNKGVTWLGITVDMDSEVGKKLGFL